MIRYTNIRIYTSEKARHEGRPVAEAVVHFIHDLKIAARCGVFRGREGLYETGEIASDALTDLSYNLPLLIDILVPTEETERIVERLKAIVRDGVIGILPVDFVSFRSERSLLPPHLLVKDVMTREVQKAHADFSLRAAIEVMLDHNLKSLPVVDGTGGVMGIVTTRDLLAASMPLRVGLFPLLPTAEREAFLAKAEAIAVTSVMTKKPVVVNESSPAARAVHLMVRKQKKRLPVVDQRGTLVGMLARIDLMRAVSAEQVLAPTDAAKSSGSFARTIKDIDRQEAAPLSDRSDLLSAVDALVRQGEDQAAVVDQEGHLVGIVSDRELFGVLGSEGFGRSVHRLFVGRKPQQVIADIMRREVVRLDQTATIDETLRLMVEQGLKRLPVVDEENRFVGMIRRDALLVALSHDL